jgi:hypothetical protein
VFQMLQKLNLNTRVPHAGALLGGQYAAAGDE